MPRKVTFGPDLFTFPEIAERLSVSGPPVRCSPELRQRAAFVSLRDRTPEETRRLLSRGLDLQFRDAGGALILERDPDTARRERTWRRRFAENLRLCFRGLLQQEQEKIRSTVEDPTVQGPPAITQRLWYDWHGRYLLTAAILESAFRQGVYSTTEPGDWPMPGMVVNMGNEWTKHLYGSYFFLRDSSSLIIQSGCRVVASKPGAGGGASTSWSGLLDFKLRATDNLSLVETVFRGGKTPELPKPLSGLGGDAVAWQDAETAATEHFLKSAEAMRPFRSPVRGEFEEWGALSLYIAAQCQQNRSEAVMELFLLVESVTTKETGVTLRNLVPVKGNWSLQMDSDVLLVTNRMAFLDRAREEPTAALLRVVRSGTVKMMPVEESLKSGEARPPKPKSPDQERVEREYVRETAGYARWRPGSEQVSFGGVRLADLDRLVRASNIHAP
jgi:hypothetical protein